MWVLLFTRLCTTILHRIFSWAHSHWAKWCISQPTLWLCMIIWLSSGIVSGSECVTYSSALKVKKHVLPFPLLPFPVVWKVNTGRGESIWITQVPQVTGRSKPNSIGAMQLLSRPQRITQIKYQGTYVHSKRQDKDWEKICANNIPEKGLCLSPFRLL